jgi:hypothetical protein
MKKDFSELLNFKTQILPNIVKCNPFAFCMTTPPATSCRSCAAGALYFSLEVFSHQI